MDWPGLRNVSSHCSIAEIDYYDMSHLLDKPRLNIERKRSFSEISIGLTRGGYDNFEIGCSPGARLGFDTPASSTRESFEPHPMVAETWEALRRSLVNFRGQPVGTIAAYDHASEEVLNYDQVFVRDFVPSALAFLMNGEPAIVKKLSREDTSPSRMGYSVLLWLITAACIKTGRPQIARRAIDLAETRLLEDI